MIIHDLLSKDEIRQITQKSDWKAALELLHTWGWIIGTFTVVAWFPSVFTIIPALFILGGKQLACAIIMHDASHRALFRSQWLNDFVGNWLGGYPVFNDCDRYRPYHLKHHVHTGTEKDPDLALTRGYPTSVKSFVRKMLRDLLGATGLKTQIGIFLMNIGSIQYTGSGEVIWIDRKNKNPLYWIKMGAYYYWKPILANFMMWLVMWLCGAGWLYWLWIGALLSTYNFSLRIRSMAEHSMVPDMQNPLLNTRTTYANWVEKMLFAPHHVNYHNEHHLLMTVPPYHLPKMHQLIKERGYYDQSLLSPNYWEIVKMAVAGKKKRSEC